MDFTNYWWQIIVLFTWGGFCYLCFPYKQEMIFGKQEWRWKRPAAILFTFPLVYFAAIRPLGYGDTGTYEDTFADLPSKLSEISAYLDNVTKDRGYTVFACVVKSVVGDHVDVYFFIVAAIQMACLVYFYRKYSCDFWLSIFIFVAGSDYMSWFHNGIRQFLGVGLIMIGIHFLLKRRYLLTIVLILLASTMHGSALLLLPVIFIVHGKAWNARTLLAILSCIVVLFFVDQFTDILDNLLSNTQYSNMVTDWIEWEDDGTNPLRVLVYSMPMLLSIVGYRYIREARDPVINMMTNFSILTCGVALVSMVTSGLFIGRLIIYGSVFSSGVLLPWEIKHMFSRNSAKLMRLMVVLCYLVFWYYQMHFTWALI